MHLFGLEFIHLHFLNLASVILMIEANDIRPLDSSSVGKWQLFEVFKPSEPICQQQFLIDENTSKFRQHDEANEMLFDGKSMVLEISRSIGLICNMPQIHQNVSKLLLMPIRHQIAEVVLPNQVKIVTL